MKLYDFEGESQDFDVDLDDENVAAAILQVVSGDEILDVVYKDGEVHTFDADTNFRTTDFLDATYILVLNGEWQVNRDKFLARKGSYDDWNE